MSKAIIFVDLPDCCGECGYNALYGDGKRRCGMGSLDDIIDEYEYSRPEWCPIKLRPEKWIPCSERLPDEDDRVLITKEWYGGGKNVVVVAYYHTKTKKFYRKWGGGVSYGNVIAWMPFPEPYEKGESDD